MDDGERSAGRGVRPRARKPTFAERRERRAEVEDIAVVLDAAARFLEARPRSEHEVRHKLTTMGYRSALVEEVVARLTDLRYLDDEAFTRAWVESRDRARPRGEHALRRELHLKGVDRALVDEVLDQRRDEAHEHDASAGDGSALSPDEIAAERLLRRKLPALLREPDPRRRRQRAYALLARSGFSPDVCGTVALRVLEAGTGDDDHPDRDGVGDRIEPA